MNIRKNRADLYVNATDESSELGRSFRSLPFDENWETNLTVVKPDESHGHPALRVEKYTNVQWYTGYKAVESALSDLREQNE